MPHHTSLIALLCVGFVMAFALGMLAQRLKLFAIEGRSGSKAALQELIDDQLMLQEAKRLNIEITDKQVEEFRASWQRYVALKNEYMQARVGDCF